jgi:UDPglucose 6-dehydrogenase
MHLKGADVRVHDPRAIANAKARFPTLTYCDSLQDACRSVDLIVLATEWDEYLTIDPVAFRSVVRQPRLLDTRNAIDRQLWVEAGWYVYALGRGALGSR